MARERIHIDISNDLDLRKLVEHVRSQGTSFVLQVADKDVAVLEPPTRSKKRRSRVVTEDDPLFRLIGIGSSDALGPGSEDKYGPCCRRYVSIAATANLTPTWWGDAE